MAFMKEGRQVSAYQQRYVFQALNAFNQRHRQTISAEYGLNLPELDEVGFTRFVGTGQPSCSTWPVHPEPHAAQVGDAAVAIRQEHAQATPQRRVELERLVDAMNSIDSEMLITAPISSPAAIRICMTDPRPKAVRTRRPFCACGQRLLPRLARFHSGSRFTLNLSNLSIPDTWKSSTTAGGMSAIWKSTTSRTPLVANGPFPVSPCASVRRRRGIGKPGADLRPGLGPAKSP